MFLKVNLDTERKTEKFMKCFLSLPFFLALLLVFGHKGQRIIGKNYLFKTFLPWASIENNIKNGLHIG